MVWNVRSSNALVVAIALLVAPTLGAQEQPSAAQYQEIMRVQRALTSLLSQAFLVDGSLDDLRLEFEQAQEKAMVALDPETAQRLDRLAELRTIHDDAATGEQNLDTEALLSEGWELFQAIEATAAAARRQPEVAKKAAAFASALEKRFQQIDPKGFQILSGNEDWIEVVWSVLLAMPRPSESDTEKSQ